MPAQLASRHVAELRALRLHDRRAAGTRPGRAFPPALCDHRVVLTPGGAQLVSMHGSGEDVVFIPRRAVQPGEYLITGEPLCASLSCHELPSVRRLALASHGLATTAGGAVWHTLGTMRTASLRWCAGGCAFRALLAGAEPQLTHTGAALRLHRRTAPGGTAALDSEACSLVELSLLALPTLLAHVPTPPQWRAPASCLRTNCRWRGTSGSARWPPPTGESLRRCAAARRDAPRCLAFCGQIAKRALRRRRPRPSDCSRAAACRQPRSSCQTPGSSLAIHTERAGPALQLLFTSGVVRLAAQRAYGRRRRRTLRRRAGPVQHGAQPVRR